ncbi:alkane 1-monooxygenase [Paracoccus aurantiacus]|uniref:Alkane 1-monooxygenase n=1 Tax=Paracoccus aurantiacus TaxID=2599412 RepID=A0A5C6S7J1_9RHOB|nr:alkane 1-monooxygenase [Paracoccus aurantiacus]TXB70477.1 alkane 1-monooxygenase [Paracoccus aurantiacus]
MSGRVPSVAAFAFVSVAPAALLIWGAANGGWTIWAGFLWMAVAAPLADTIIARGFGDVEDGARFPGANALLVVLAIIHLDLLVGTLRAFANDWLSGLERVALFLGAGMWFGQVSNSFAHELIHRRSRGLFRLGAAVYVSLLFGHHVSAHRLVHHVHVATDGDPNSARKGESFWRFFPRAWFGSFKAGLMAERKRAASSGRLNPYVFWLGGAVLCMVLVWSIFGPRATLDYLLLCLYAQMQLMLSDYVQHYGLRRARDDGRPEPVGPRHSWDAPHPFSSLAMVNAPRHSDHHAHPGREYPVLRLGAEKRPMLPYSLPVMGAIAMVPPLWRRVMDRRVLRMN